MSPTTQVFGDLNIEAVADITETLEWALQNADDVAMNGKSVSDCFFGSLVEILDNDPDNALEIARRARIHVAGVAYKKAGFDIQIAAARYDEARRTEGVARLFATLQTIIKAVSTFQQTERVLIGLTSMAVLEDAKAR